MGGPDHERKNGGLPSLAPGYRGAKSKRAPQHPDRHEGHSSHVEPKSPWRDPPPAGFPGHGCLPSARCAHGVCAGSLPGCREVNARLHRLIGHPVGSRLVAARLDYPQRGGELTAAPHGERGRHGD